MTQDASQHTPPAPARPESGPAPSRADVRPVRTAQTGFETEAEPRRVTPGSSERRRVAIVTGSRADFGLLVPVIEAAQRHAALETLVIAAGAHLIQPAPTFREVRSRFPVADSVPMQTAGRTGRLADVEAVGKGVARFGRSFALLEPDWVVVLGDRIEAFAAASAASIGGIALAHIHGGDRAEGVADEAMRHAVTKLAHLHLAATEASAERIRRMGERPDLVRAVGSPAIDALAGVTPMTDAEAAELGDPEAVFLMHPVGRHPEEEELVAAAALAAMDGLRVLALHPNHDPGRDGIMRAISNADGRVTIAQHLERPLFLALLARLRERAGALVGNSSAGLIEAAAIGCPAVDIGPRQAGRERPASVVPAPAESEPAIREAVAAARALRPEPYDHPYGDGNAGLRIAEALASIDPRDPALLRKRCVY